MRYREETAGSGIDRVHRITLASKIRVAMDCHVGKFPLYFITFRCLGATMTCYRLLNFVWRLGADVAIFAIGPTSSVIAQTSDKLCRTEVSAEIAKSTLRWESFNDFGNSKFAYSESGFRMDGQGASCRIHSVRSDNKAGERVCTWNARLDCELLLGQDAISHKFFQGDVSQYGKLKWASNEKLDVKVKRGDVTTTESREVAVVKFDGRWSRGSDSGRSISTAYFDRMWGVLLKIEGAHDFNKFGDVVSIVEFP